ncbi:dna gyrase subunit b : DNA gyrase subunit B OS=Methanosalsum zhilinae (strain DSM 4017 / NBRC 107636 / OCM 62 / WeN5) GN=gyrB PE=3 SV=1: DNA_gyraseB [Gemmataceae bacterium]|nr:dna gyrase subunit b : DNA gyrase subunit B OS=Methanosalsum zhilinae (strain DSM 4017 / NBRC 107636 / OCM 62 / WeN5) GN=gyrB PE=3 SV=1: DNA_gyraseB [Gemmataceae bacterium]VTT97196.1 dna gyrase subunit b : DNA gyrase subunit B OS=Methanosalsum zhilinae (strain DSM 4017 / NBRC 107636 / OCM 62 / WeN5) GN=gyrB PE=3 SV=1: DNA_gyraseB [Gemmataceae bacterium]
MSTDGQPPRDLTAEELARQQSSYSDPDIRIFRDPAHIRMNPGMYIGNVRTEGLHAMLLGIVGEFLGSVGPHAGRTLAVTLHPDGSVQVADSFPRADFRGTRSLTEAFRETFWLPGWPWLQSASANALSEWCEVEADHAGHRHRQKYDRGQPTGDGGIVGPARGEGLTISFRPDASVFESVQFHPDIIRERLREYAFLNAGVRFTLTDNVTGTIEVFEFAGGVADFVRWLNVGSQHLHPGVLFTRGEVGDVRYEVAMQWCRTDETIERLYVNDRIAPLGGTPITGIRTGVTRVVNAFIRNYLPDAAPAKGSNVRNGLTAVVSVRMTDPWFEGATRSRLGNHEAEGILAAAVSELLRREFAANPAVAEQVAWAAIADAEAEAVEKRRRKKKP